LIILLPFILFRLLSDQDEDVQEQAFNVVRNLTESEDGIAMVFKEVGKEVLGCITVGLNSVNDNVVLQVFVILIYHLFYLSFC
jgi:armadillo repeat-containing protein 8